jgi:hypothetical protein
MGKGKKGRDKSIVDFINFIYSTAASSLVTIPINPNNTLSTRVSTEADAWALYKVTRLRFRLRRPGTAGASPAGTYQVAAFVVGVVDATPTQSGLNQAYGRVVLMNQETVPTEWSVVPAADLVGYQPWYKTIAGSPATTSEVLGNIYICTGSATDDTAIEIQGTFVFRDALAPSLTPMMVDLKERERLQKVIQAQQVERERLVALLAGNASVARDTSKPGSPLVLLPSRTGGAPQP